MWSERARRVIPGGASTGSKRDAALYGAALAPDLPTHFRRAYGCRVETADGRDLVDCTMALGAVAFGYADAEVDAAVYAAVRDGNVGGLSPLLEIEVAERLIDVVPCAEQVRFLRSGAEATAAALRLARAATGRDRIIACGYFGWHDWSNAGPGVPHGANADVQMVSFNDAAALEYAAQEAGQSLAAIVIEPLVHEIASDEWLRTARRLADTMGAVLVFDEIKTAFRIRTGGVQELRGITSDLTCLGKAMANGFPIAAVVGKREVMEFARSAWISSTLASETTALAATRAVLDRHARTDVCGELARVGQRMQAVVRDAIAPHTLGISVQGPPHMWRFVSDNQERIDALVAESAREGVLLKRGAYQFAALAHDDSALDQIGASVARAAATVSAQFADATVRPT